MAATTVHPTRKDFAEFFRLGLLAKVCDLPAVVRWTDSIVGDESTPAFVFIELSLGGSQSVSTVTKLLLEVPGENTPELAARMLLGRCFRLVQSGECIAEEILAHLLSVIRLGNLPEHVTEALSGYDDEFSLARDHITGTSSEATKHFSDFLQEFEPYARLVPVDVG